METPQMMIQVLRADSASCFPACHPPGLQQSMYCGLTGSANRMAATACAAEDGRHKSSATGLLSPLPEEPLVWGVCIRPFLGRVLLQERSGILPQAAELRALHTSQRQPAASAARCLCPCPVQGAGQGPHRHCWYSPGLAV